MHNNIRDRNDFYEKFYRFFSQLGDYEKDNGVFSATITILIRLLENYINSEVSDNDSLKPLLTALKQKIDIDSRHGVSNEDMVYNVSRYVSKIKTIRQTRAVAPMSVMRTIKPGVALVFKQYPILEMIGTEEEYSEYLDAIFSHSKIKDIFYHGTNKQFNTFEGMDFFFTKDIALASHVSKIRGEGTPQILSVILDAKRIWDYQIQGKGMEIANFHFDKLKREGYDAIINKKEIAVMTTNQIYILGSQQDMDGFHNFVRLKRANSRTSLTA